MEQPVLDFHPELYGEMKNPGLLAKTGTLFYDLRRNQPRVRERIMKLS
jgi:hypothetical protein